MPHGSVSPALCMVNAKLAGYASVGDLGKFLPNLILENCARQSKMSRIVFPVSYLSIFQAFIAGRRHVIHFVGQLNQQINVSFPYALQECVQCGHCIRTLGDDVEPLLRTDGGRYVRCIVVA